MKRIFALLLAAIMVCAALPALGDSPQKNNLFGSLFNNMTGTTQTDAPATLLRYDGLYCFDEAYNGNMFSYVLRFYPDGTVICTSILGEAAKGNFPSASRMVKNGSDSDPDDIYNLDGDQIAFTNVSESGTVDHWGTVMNDRLRLSSHSNINGNERIDADYLFYPFSGISGYPADSVPAGGNTQPIVQPEPQPAAQVRTDGLYFYSSSTMRYVLRFFEDGSLLANFFSLSSMPEGTYPTQSDMAASQKGPAPYADSYILSGSQLSFTTIASNGTVDYSGTVGETTLDLHWHSNINGNDGDRYYVFMPFSEIPGWGGAASSQPAQPSQPTSQQSGQVRTDGLYFFSNSTTRYILRFFDDGSLLANFFSLSSMPEGTYPTQSDMAASQKGPAPYADSYTVNGSQISFTTIASNGTVDYSGTVGATTLDLHWHSNINGNDGDRYYVFTPFSEMPGWGGAASSQPAAPQQNGQLRTDGIYLYVSGSEQRYLLRFYSDNTVAYNFYDQNSNSLINGLPVDGALNSSNNVTFGDRVSLSGSNISFTTNSSSGAVDYTGTVGYNSLSLDWTSHINGRTGHEDYAFYSFTELGWSSEAGSSSAPAPAAQGGDQVRTDGIYLYVDGSLYYMMRFNDDNTISYTCVMSGSDRLKNGLPADGALTKNNSINAADDAVTINGSRVTFTTHSGQGAVDYVGSVSGNTLSLDWTSHINGRSGHEDYTFYSFTELGWSSAGASTSANTASNTAQQTAQLRYDGLYCFDEEYNGTMFSYVLRFYPDGTMICTSIVGEAAKGDFPRASRMVKNGSSSDPDDTYTLNGDQISFTNTSESGTVDHWGTVMSDRLRLDTHSNINGNERKNADYLFYPFSNMNGYPADEVPQATTNTSTNSNTNNTSSASSLLRFDGLYACDYGNYSYTFRFFEDGTVICYTNGNGFAKDGSFPSYSKLVKNANLPYDPDGTYTIVGNQITFSDTFENGSVDYTGTIEEGRLILSSHSNVNGNERKNAEHIFYPSTMIPGWPQNESSSSSSSSSKVRTDGLYIYDSGYSYVLRFFDDGMVICHTHSSGFAKDGSFPTQSSMQPGAGLPYDYDDTYMVNGSRITFTDAFENGTIDYTGTVEADRMTLNWHSNVNGNDGTNNVYIFYPFTSIPGWSN